jgi:hypothetical protein
MHGRITTYTDLNDIVSDYIHRYYDLVTEDREIRRDSEMHITLITHLHQQFVREYRAQEFYVYSFDNERIFLTRIEYLTQAQKKATADKKRKTWLEDKTKPTYKEKAPVSY